MSQSEFGYKFDLNKGHPHIGLDPRYQRTWGFPGRKELKDLMFLLSYLLVCDMHLNYLQNNDLASLQTNEMG